VLNVPETIEAIPFEQLVLQATGLSRAERRSIKGKEMLVAHLVFDRTKDQGGAWDVEIHFDPAVNYVVRKTIYTASGTNGRFIREDEVIQFKECAPGLFFPERLEGHSELNGKPDFNHTTVISDIRVNQPLPDDIFRLHYPEGVNLSDQIRNIRYRVDSEGHQTSAGTPLQGRVVPPPPERQSDSSGPGMETQEEPRSASRWVLPVSLVILAFAGIAVFVRRWRRIATVG
jgi:hypothetical protein